MAEVGEVGVAELEGDAFGGFAFGQEVGGEIEAGGVEEFARAEVEVVLAAAFELAQGDAELRGGGAGIVVAALGEFEPER